MPSAYDSCRPVAVESPAEGGTQLRTSPSEMDPTQDAAAVAAVHLVGSSATANDKSVYVDRTASGLRFTDSAVQRLLSELMAVTDGSTQSHSASRDLSHLLGGQGPGPGVAPSGAVSQCLYSGALLTSETWYTSSNMTTKIVGRTIAYPTGSVFPSSETWTVYNAAGAAIRTLTDTFTFTNGLLVSTSRAWS